MNLGRAKLIQIILLVICCITFIVGLGLSKRAGEERAHDLSKVKVEIESKEVYFNPEERGYRNGAYHIRLQYVIQNNTSRTICTVYVETTVYDQNGKELGTIKTSFGDGTNEGLWLKPGQSVDVTFGIPLERLKTVQEDGSRKLLKGDYTIAVSSAAPCRRSVELGVSTLQSQVKF